MDKNELKEIQENLELSNKELAEWLGYSVSNVVKMRNGKTAIPGPVARSMRMRLAIQDFSMLHPTANAVRALTAAVGGD